LPIMCSASCWFSEKRTGRIETWSAKSLYDFGAPEEQRVRNRRAEEGKWDFRFPGESQMVKYTTFEFEEHGDERGILISLEENRNIPFDIRRCYFMYNTQPGISRGFHAHKTLRQVLVCVRGSCRILLDDGKEKASVLLDRPNKGLYITSNLWRVMTDFSEDAVLMVLADQLYDESDYIRDYDAFLAYLRDNGEKKPDQESILPEENK